MAREMTTSVKHLNPRQGITTDECPLFRTFRDGRCETPKSPPGDYNFDTSVKMTTPSGLVWCETPKSPPGDYNTVRLTHSTACRFSAV